MAPDFGDLRDVEVVGIVLGMLQRRGLGVFLARLRADVGIAQDVESFGVGRHHAVFDAVVNHLDEMTGAVRAAMQVAASRRCLVHQDWGS